MLDHTGIVGSDLPRARRFYDAIAKVLGLGTKDISPESARAPASTRCTSRFAQRARSRSRRFHRAAIEAGGKDNGEPGPREGAMGYYGAFALDPDGNNIEACYRGK